MVYKPCEKDFQVHFVSIYFYSSLPTLHVFGFALLFAHPLYSSHHFQQISFDEIIEKMKETVLSMDMLTASPDFETLTEPTEYEVMNSPQSRLCRIC